MNANEKLAEIESALPNHPFRAKLLKLAGEAIDRRDEILAKHMFERALNHLLKSWSDAELAR